MTREEWQEQFDQAFPNGAKVLIDEGWQFHVPRVMVATASDRTLELLLWQMDANDGQPIVVPVEPPADIEPPHVDLEIQNELTDKIRIVNAFPPALQQLRREWLQNPAFQDEVSDATP